MTPHVVTFALTKLYALSGTVESDPKMSSLRICPTSLRSLGGTPPPAHQKQPISPGGLIKHITYTVVFPMSKSVYCAGAQSAQ